MDENNALNVTYSAVVGATYKNVDLPVSAIVEGHNAFTAKVTNNGTETVTLRVDILAAELVNEHTKACNLSATMDGAAVNTDLEWGGSTFTIEAGKTVSISVVFDASKDAQNVQFLIDSSIYQDTATHSGDVTFTEMAFSGEAGTEQPGTEEPEQPAGENASITFIQQNGYTVTPNGTAAESVTVTYDKSIEFAYANITAPVAELAAGNNEFSLKIKNNGEAAVNVRVDIQGTTKVSTGENSSTDACNVSATSIGGTGLRTDTVWGGTFVTVAAEEEVTLTIVYNGEGAQGAVKNILVYLDSNSEDFATFSGNVTLSDFIFASSQAQA